MVYNWLSWCQRHLLPGRCCLCLAGDPSGLGLCPGCCDDLPWLEAGCPGCALPLTSKTGVCGACQTRPPHFDDTLALFRYAPPIDSLIQQFKFGRALQHAPLFAALFLARLGDRPAPDCIMPVPLHPRRQRERGYNQALEIARPLARRLGCRLDSHSCVRIRHSPPQSLLSAAQRRRNLQRTFAIQQAVKARSVALVDDVMTTGSTVNAIARLLREQGVERISVWVCARTVTHR